MSYFDESLQGMDPTILRNSMTQMKEDLQQDLKDDLYNAEEAEFITAAIDNLDEEIKGLKSFDNLKIKQKARIIAYMSFIFDIMDEGDFDDEDFDDDGFGDEEEEDDDDDDDEGDDDTDDRKGKKSKLKIESFPK